MKQKTLSEKIKQHSDIKVPWEVGRFLNAKVVYQMGDQACLTNEGDYGTLPELQKAVEWYVNQLGGVVKWNNKNT